MDSNIIAAVITGAVSILTALIAARGQGKRKQVEEVGATQVIVKKRLRSPGWRAVWWLIAALFAFSFIRNLMQPTLYAPMQPPIYTPPPQTASMCVTTAGVCTLPPGPRGVVCTCFTQFGPMQGISQ